MAQNEKIQYGTEQQNNKLMHLTQHCNWCGSHCNSRDGCIYACDAAMLCVMCMQWASLVTKICIMRQDFWCLFDGCQSKNMWELKVSSLSTKSHHSWIINII
jgi:hypothetical protein